MSGNLENILQGEIPFEVKYLNKVCSQEVPYKLLSLAVKCPEFFKSGPIIYPHRIQSIVDWNEDVDPKRSKNQDKLLEQLESTAVGDPWKFGFNDLMFQKTGFSGLEAKYSAIKSAFWFQNLDKLKRDALLLYDMFRFTCQNNGHTFLSHRLVYTFSENSHWKYYKKRGNKDDGIPDDGAIRQAKYFLIHHEIFTLA